MCLKVVYHLKSKITCSVLTQINDHVICMVTATIAILMNLANRITLHQPIDLRMAPLPTKYEIVVIDLLVVFDTESLKYTVQNKQGLLLIEISRIRHTYFACFMFFL